MWMLCPCGWEEKKTHIKKKHLRAVYEPTIKAISKKKTNKNFFKRLLINEFVGMEKISFLDGQPFMQIKLKISMHHKTYANLRL